jgi:hypothetical protein
LPTRRYNAPSHRFDDVPVAVPNDHRNVFARRDVEARLEQRQVLREIETNPQIGEFTGKEIVSAAHGSGTYNCASLKRQCHYLERSVELFNPTPNWPFLPSTHAVFLPLLTTLSMACAFVTNGVKEQSVARFRTHIEAHVCERLST